MNDRIKFRRKFFAALSAAAGLIFAAVVTWAAFPAAPPAPNFADSHQNSSHLVLHGVNFSSTTGKLDDGSKAVLDEAADVLKQDPDATVSVDQDRAADPKGACGLTPAQTREIARYIEARGIPATRLMLCQATPASVPAPEEPPTQT